MLHRGKAVLVENHSDTQGSWKDNNNFYTTMGLVFAGPILLACMRRVIFIALADAHRC